jgi:GT2 family glycosyltransferase
MVNCPLHVTAIVLHYRYWPGIRETLDALLEGECLPDRLVVVDNCPGCWEAECIAAAYPMAELIRSRENRGYAGGMNLGLGAVRGTDAVLLITQDCLLERSALEAMLGELADRKVGAVGPLVGRAGSEEVWGIGGWVKRGGTGRYGDKDHISEWLHTGPFDTQWTDGCCILLRQTAMQSVGQFDERFFMYFEEVDYLLRMLRQGWSVRVTPRARAWQSSGGPGIALYIRNQLLLTEKHFGCRAALRSLLVQLRDIVLELSGSRPVDARERARGVALFLLRVWGPVSPGSAEPKLRAWWPRRPGNTRQ